MTSLEKYERWYQNHTRTWRIQNLVRWKVARVWAALLGKPDPALVMYWQAEEIRSLEWKGVEE